MLDDSIRSMKVARQSYAAANNIAQKCECDPAFMLKIKGFDFDQFQQNNSLIPSTFGTARDYLTENVKGIYSKMATDSENILFMLQGIRNQVDNEKLSEFHSIWKCNQAFFETHLFGQYISMVMFELMNA